MAETAEPTAGSLATALGQTITAAKRTVQRGRHIAFEWPRLLRRPVQPGQDANHLRSFPLAFRPARSSASTTCASRKIG